MSESSVMRRRAGWLVTLAVGVVQASAAMAATPMPAPAACSRIYATDAGIPQSDPRVRATLGLVIPGLVREGNGTVGCSAVLLNDAQDSHGTPMIVTAGHCMGAATVGETFDTQLYWASDNPGVYDHPYSATNPIPNGAQFRAYTVKVLARYSDAALLSLNAPPPAGAWFAGWNAAPFTAGTPVTNLNLSAYGPMQYATAAEVADNTTAPGAYANSSSGVLVGGASGSGVFDSSNDWVGAAVGSTNPASTPPCQTIAVVSAAQAYAGDGTPSGSFGPWLALSTGATQAPGAAATSAAGVPPLGQPAPTTTPVASGGSGGGAFGPGWLLGLLGLVALRRRRG